ncbi:Urease accessory protein UreD [Patulibacter medicamentivorans]|uniref:Urease accessory protein UreD n=1 Tax=Patulibacter medicamentivorans TaxID=1097667 RepID=H0E108_9ACTN|nr:Urease accessory protein UreD [Patulibacter medicamentivorans]
MPGPVAAPAPAAVHRRGRLAVRLERRGSRTVVAADEVAFPAGTVRLTDGDGDGLRELQITSPSGGLLAGDRLDTIVEAGAGTSVSLVTQGATRVYRARDGAPASGGDPPALASTGDPRDHPADANGGPASDHASAGRADPTVLDTSIAVAARARVEWVPHHLMPYADAAVHQRTTIDVAASGALLAWESVAAGRSARGERFGWRRLDTRLRISRDGRPLLQDGADLGPGGEPFDGADLVSTVVVVLPDPAASSASAARGLADDLADALADRPGVLGSASAPDDALVVARVLARDAPALYGALHAVRVRARAVLELPAPGRPVA